MLAYVFWHRPRDGADRTVYERALLDFHAALAAEPPPGFATSWTFHADALPWLGSGAGYEDWYLVEGSAALDLLNDAAISGARRAHHDEAARVTAVGAAGLYRLRSGAADPKVTRARWSSRPLARGAAVWQRQMVLGPTPEWLAHDSDEAGEIQVALELVSS